MLYFNIDTTSYEFKIYVELYTGKCDTINTGVIIEKKCYFKDSVYMYLIK